MIEARTEEAAAVTSRNDAVTARNDLATKNTELEQSQAVIVGKNTEIVKKNTELERSQDQLEGALARTWLSPLAEKPGPLNEVEIATLTQMSSPGNDRLAEHFLAEALGSRQGMRKLRRAPPSRCTAWWAWMHASGRRRRGAWCAPWNGPTWRTSRGSTWH